MFSRVFSLLWICVLLGWAPGHANGAILAATSSSLPVLQQLCAGALQNLSPAHLAALGVGAALAGSAVVVPALDAQLPLLSAKVRSCVAGLLDSASMSVHGRPAAIGDLRQQSWTLTPLRVQHLIENPGAGGSSSPLASQPAKTIAETKDYAVGEKRSSIRLGLEVPPHKQFNLNDILGTDGKAQLTTTIAESHRRLLSDTDERGELLLSSLNPMPKFAADFRRQVGADSDVSVEVRAIFNSFAGWATYGKGPLHADTLRGDKQLIAGVRDPSHEFHVDRVSGERYVCTLLGPPTLFVKNVDATRLAADRGVRHLENVLNHITPEDNEFTFVPARQCAPTVVQKGDEGREPVHYFHAIPPPPSTSSGAGGPQNRLLLVIDLYN